MRLPIPARFLGLIVLLLVANVGFAQDELKERKTELEKAIGQLRESLESEASPADLTFPEDPTQRFTVKELRISGNNLISTAKLIEKLPLAYTLYETEPVTGRYKKDPNTGKRIVKDVYDFRVLSEIIVEPGRGREVSLKTIQGFNKYILSIYKEKGYAGIYVYVPVEAVETVDEKDKLVDEILPIQVLEGRVAELTVERYNFERQIREKGFLKESVLKAWSPVKEGDAIQKKKVDDFVRLLNRNPDRYVSAIISRSAEPNALNLGYDVYEASPWHWYIQVDNSGTQDRQWSPRIGLINTNLIGVDDRISVMFQAPWDSGIEDQWSLFGSYDFPVLTPRLRLSVYGAHSEFDIRAAGMGFIGNGSLCGGILSYNVFQINDWFVDVTSSLSYEASKVTPWLGLASNVNMNLWGVGVNVHRSGDMSNTSLTFNITKSIGGSSQAAFENAWPGADPDFAIYNLGVTHSRYLDRDKVGRLSGSFRFIASDSRLVPAKQTTFGGLYSVRGYREDEIVADGGVLVSGQYEFDLVKRKEARENPKTESEETQKKKPWVRKVAPLAFIDCGRAKRKSPRAGEWGAQELLSIGLGVNVDLGDNFSGGVYYGWPLLATEQTGQGDGRFIFSFIYRF